MERSISAEEKRAHAIEDASLIAPGRSGSSDGGVASTDAGAGAVEPKKVYGRLNKTCPHIGFFHYAPSAGNRSRRTYFEKDIMSMEDMRRQHEVRSNAMIGIFHYGHDLYGERYEDFQRILNKLQAKEVERGVEAVRQARPFGGTLSPASSAALAAHHHRGRARSVTNSGESSDRCRMTRSNSVGDAIKLAKANAGPAAVAADEDYKASPRRGVTETLPPAGNGVDGGQCGGGLSNGLIMSSGAEAPILGGPVPSAGARAISSSGGMCAAREGDTACEGLATSVLGTTDSHAWSLQASEGRLSTVDSEGKIDEHSDVEGGDVGDDDPSIGLDEYQERESRRLRKDAFAIVVYGSGDSLVKLAEKERRNGVSTKRFKYAGAIDTSRSYPKSGSLDDCALLQPVVAERSRLYNDLIAETNGFRRHFFLRQKMHPKEAYRQARRRQGADADLAHMDEMSLRGRQKSDSWLFIDASLRAAHVYSYGSMGSDVSGNLNGPIAGGNGVLSANVDWVGKGGGGGADYYGVGAGGGQGSAGGSFYDYPARMGGAGMDDGAPPFHTLVGPGQALRQRTAEASQPGGTWMPGTVSAQRAKESWQGKQEMRDFRKFNPFFVQAKTDFTATYKLLEDCLLGEGSYASVYQAVHIKRGDKVAVKAVQKRLLFSEIEQKSVRAEIDNQLRVVHKHVVRLYEVYETPDYVYIVLENCPFGDLEKMMYLRGRLTEIEAKRVTMQLLAAVEYLHSAGIVHCDIKPQNLLFAHDPASPEAAAEEAAELAADGGGEAGAAKGGAKEGTAPKCEKQQVASPAGKLAKLCDFGISCKVPDVRFYKQTGDINKIPWSGLFGTGGYIAPEIMLQEPFGKPADLWSVGVMLYQMISGRLPFIPARACVSKPVAFPAAVWTNVSMATQDLIRGLLEKDPAQRLTAAQALQHPWIQTIHHLRPSFPHFVPVARQNSNCSMSSSTTGGGGGGGGEAGDSSRDR